MTNISSQLEANNTAALCEYHCCQPHTSFAVSYTSAPLRTHFKSKSV